MAKAKKTSKMLKLTTWGKVWRVALAIAVPLGGGVIIALLTSDTMKQFGMFKQPPLSPPAILFPIAWTILYILMGVASYLIWRKSMDAKGKMSRDGKVALGLYAVQLVMNFIWTPLFFTWALYWVAFVWLFVMWALIIVLMAITYKKISKTAFWLLLPYLLWCTFAAYLNCGIAILN